MSHGDVASAIGAQVEQMILQAKKDSETRVRTELQIARNQLNHMEAAIQELSERVTRCVHGGGAPDMSTIVDNNFLTQKISQLEQKWGSEVKALKQDLHRTILAHNHNSDLMRHHRDALDEARRKLDQHTQPKPEQVDAQIEKMDRMLRAGQVKQRALEALTERLTQLETQVGEMLPGGGLGFPGVVPGMAGSALGLSMAPGLAGPAAPKRGAKKDEPPTDEEVRARMLQAVAAKASSDTSTTFNAEAPVFVPRSVATEGAGAAAAAASSSSVKAEAKAAAAAPAEDPAGAPEKAAPEPAEPAGAAPEQDPGPPAAAEASGEADAKPAEEAPAA